jgi:quercetin dioxygenase-like cupin family protein
MSMQNKSMVNPFVEDSSVEWTNVDKGVRRKIMSYDEQLMLVKVAFEKGAMGNLHHHYHAQITYVSKGAFEVEIDHQKKVLRTGDIFHVIPHLVHGVVCLEEGELIDVFNPYREDFVGKI